jgi:uncharacterized membrane protein
MASSIEHMAEPGRPPRTQSIDLLRGAVMVLMVLDHARDFWFGFRVEPTNLEKTSVILFITRWVTHFCAPVFVFLAGTSAYLYGKRHGKEGVTTYLLSRGAWLVLLELTIIRLGWIPELGYHFSVLQVIWAIGWSMIVLALLSRLPVTAVAAIGAIIVVGHNLLDRFDGDDHGAWQPLWLLMHKRGVLEPVPNHVLFVMYPLLAWFGVIALGYAFGSIFDRPAEERRRLLLRIGLGAIAAFLVLRAPNLYGDPSPWSVQPRGAEFTVLSFFNCTKYPPSLLFLLMTLGPALLCLRAVDEAEVPAWVAPLAVFGRVPLLFYVAHLYLLRFTAAPISFMKFGPNAFLPPPGHGASAEFPLYAAYLAWLTALLLLYPLCRWFSALKARRKDWWLSYL